MKGKALASKRRQIRDDAYRAELEEQLARDPLFAIAQVVLLAKLILVVVLLDPRSFDTFTLPKSVASHAASLVLAALLVWLTARYGRVLFFWSPTHIGAGALLIAFAIATPLALEPAIGLFGVFKRYLGLTQMVDNVFLYFAAGMLLQGQRSLRLLAIVITGTAAPVLLYAFGQRLGFDPLKFEQGPTTIPISTLGNPDLTGAYLTIVGMTALGFAFLLWDRLAGAYRIALVVLGIACLFGLYATGVRAGVLGIAAGWLAILVLALRMPGQPAWRGWGVAALGAVLAVGIVVSPIGARLRPDYMQADTAVQNRIELWSTALRAVVARPVLGIGPDNFAVYYPAHRPEASALSGEPQNSTHDLWLYVATSAGLVGVAALVFLIVALAIRAYQLAGRGNDAALALVPLFAYLGTSLVNVNEVVLDWTFWVAAGVLASAGALPLLPRRPNRFDVRSPRTRLGVLALGTAIALVVFTQIPRLVASEAMLASEAFAGANRGVEAIPFGQQAVAADPRRAENWSTYGTALFVGQKLPAAAAAYTAAAALQSWQGQSWRNLAITWGAMGNTVATLAAAERAVATDPYDSVNHALLSSIVYDRGDFARAAAEGERAIALSLSPTSGSYFITISAYAQLKQLDQAEPLSRRAVAAYPTKPLQLQLAAILADEGKKEEAVAVLDGLLKQFPDDVDSLRLKAAILGK